MNKYINPIFLFVFFNGPVVEFLLSVSEVQLLGSNPLKFFFFFLHIKNEYAYQWLYTKHKNISYHCL